MRTGFGSVIFSCLYQDSNQLLSVGNQNDTGTAGYVSRLAIGNGFVARAGFGTGFFLQPAARMKTPTLRATDVGFRIRALK